MGTVTLENERMKFALLILTSNALLGIGNVTEGPLSDYANLGAVAVLSLILMWVVMKGYPAMLNDTREERGALLVRLDSLEMRRHEDSEKLREVLDKMLSHCMAERG